MTDHPAAAGLPRARERHAGLRLAALTAVIAGVLLLAAAAFALSYSGIHEIARQSGVSPTLARLYPVIFDAMLVIAGAAVLALRDAGWWSRLYAWLSLLLLLGAVAAGDAVHSMNLALPRQSFRAVVAVTPWVLLLLAFGLLLAMLRRLRKSRAASAAAAPGPRPAGENRNGLPPGGEAAVTWASRGAPAGRAGTPPAGIEMLLEPRPRPLPPDSPATMPDTAPQPAHQDADLDHGPYVVHEDYDDGYPAENALMAPGQVTDAPLAQPAVAQPAAGGRAATGPEGSGPEVVAPEETGPIDGNLAGPASGGAHEQAAPAHEQAAPAHEQAAPAHEQAGRPGSDEPGPATQAPPAPQSPPSSPATAVAPAAREPGASPVPPLVTPPPAPPGSQATPLAAAPATPAAAPPATPAAASMTGATTDSPADEGDAEPVPHPAQPDAQEAPPPFNRIRSGPVPPGGGAPASG